LPVDQLPLEEDITTIDQFNFLIFALPLPNSVKNPVNTDILIRIVGFGATPLDPSTLLFEVNGIDVTSSIIITPFAGGLELFYDPAVDFPYSSIVNVKLSIDDEDVPPRTIGTSYNFFIVNDTNKPFIEEFYPPDDSIDNLPDTEVYVIIKDLETGIDLDSIDLYIEGILVDSTLTELSVASGYAVKASYLPSEPFFYSSRVSASVKVEDNDGNRFIGVWSFSIKPSQGVLFIKVDPESCQELVPVDSQVCIEAFGLDDGIELDSFNLDIEGEEVVYILQPKVYRKE